MYAYKIFGKCKIIYLSLYQRSLVLCILYFPSVLIYFLHTQLKTPFIFFPFIPSFFLKPVTPLSGTPHPFLLSTFCFCSNLYIYI